MNNLESTLVLLGGFAIVAVAANQIAQFFQKAKLPLITGLLVIGLLRAFYIQTTTIRDGQWFTIYQ
jgi:low affinity Fe/Cu permease